MKEFYYLDMILSVGYRVKSPQGIMFRRWANSILKEYLLHGHAINQRIERLEQRVSKTEEQIGFFVRTALPPVEGVFYDGQIFDAYAFAADLIRSAQRRIILIDNYIDDSVLLTLAKRKEGVAAEIVTRHVSETLKLDLERHNRQVPRTAPLPHTAAVALCGVIRMACLGTRAVSGLRRYAMQLRPRRR